MMDRATIVAIVYGVVRGALQVLEWYEVDWAPTAIPFVDIFFMLLLLALLNKDVEKDVERIGFAGLYNVVVVSWIAAIPQTVVAVVFAESGHYYAAFVDSMTSTLVDAFLVTAVARREALSMAASYWPALVIWSASVIAFGATSTSLPYYPVPAAWFVIGALILPLLFAPKTPGGGMELNTFFDLLFTTAALGWIALDIGHALVALHSLSEGLLGVVGALVATSPDLIAAFSIRFILARSIGAVAGDDVMVRTMLASAVHDQISDPALVLMISTQAALFFPHLLNIVIALLVLTLLSPKLYWYVGLPAAVALMFLAALGILAPA